MKKKSIKKNQDSVFERLHQAFTNGTFRGICGEAKIWLIEKKLDAKVCGAGYNSNQFHTRNRELIPELLQTGFLWEKGQSKYDTKGYTSFGARQVMFALKDENNNVVNFCAVDMKTGKHSFLNAEGIYPGYPAEKTTRLFLVVSVMDAATILCSGVLKEYDAVMAIGSQELKEMHQEAIKRLPHLKDVYHIISLKSLYQ
ncbi:MAG TPA: hypothetical protein PK637_18770 [Flavobacteriales bacterium]|nr:hypothetical protein [Flavobacteriales bacterium]